MSDHNRRTDWSMFGAIALIALGVWLLLGKLPWWGVVREQLQWVSRLAWPLALIAVGVMLLLVGKRGGSAGTRASGKRLYRSRSDRMVGGVLGGLGEYFGFDPRWIRIIFVALVVISDFGPAFILYLIGLIAIPEEPVAPPQQPEWPQQGSWPQGTGTETVQTPPPAPPAPPVPQPPVGQPPVPPAPPQG